jgi:hypothetical protein
MIIIIVTAVETSNLTISTMFAWFLCMFAFLWSTYKDHCLYISYSLRNAAKTGTESDNLDFYYNLLTHSNFS